MVYILIMKYFLLILSLWALPALAAKPLPATESQPQLVYGYAHFPPFMCSQQESHSGIDLLLIRELGKRLGLKIKMKEYPFKRLLQSMKTGQIDIMTSLAKRPDREAYMTYLQPSYFALGPTFYVRAGYEKSIQRYEDLYRVTVGMSADSAFFEPFDSDDMIRKYPVSFELQLLRMLTNERVDAIIGSNGQMDYLLHEEGLTGTISKARYRPEKVTNVFLALSQQSPFAQQADRFNRTLQEIIADGTLDRFLDQQCDVSASDIQDTPQSANSTQ